MHPQNILLCTLVTANCFSGQSRLHCGSGLFSHSGHDVGVAVKSKGHGSVPKKLLDEFGMVTTRVAASRMCAGGR